ncbi:DNA ligase [Rhodocyclus tenuis]|uniref:DNA ligase n=1 Tax=Rhodocyclus tenuis TaxID=1066 RepID=UPI00190451D3|nr:DNA ligase [Rhodocyclus tenuis]MBK1679785.1 DNA ligase [Rhodocyclus tenuis]
MSAPLRETFSVVVLASGLFWPPAVPALSADAPVAPGSAAPIAASVNPPPLLLAANYRDSVDPSAYWVSEKLDGVRAFWDGTTLRFRSGRAIAAPAWFTAALPPHPLDGELWLGRGQFDALSAIVRREPPLESEWRRLQLRVFELPPATADEAALTFSERWQRLRQLVAAAGVPWLEAVAQFRVADRGELAQQLAATVAAGGEGLMLHRADAPYLTGRNDALLKLKPWHDAEATVLAHLPGKGRLHGSVGALLMQTDDGRRFRLGSGLSDALRQNPPPPGTRLSYRYTELTPAGLPRFPRYWRVADAF